MASVPLALRCTSPLGVVPVGQEDDVGHCRGAASSPENGSFISLGPFFWGMRAYLVFKGMVSIWVSLLGMLAATREPTSCCHDAYSVSLKGHVPQCPPRGNRVLLVGKRTLYCFWGKVVWMLHIGRARASWAWWEVVQSWSTIH